MTNPTQAPPHGPTARLPLPLVLLRALLPAAEREEVLGDLRQEAGERRRAAGRLRAALWLWRQVLSSVPSLLRRSWWRGWNGFEPNANRLQPGGPMLESWIMDVRFAARRLRTRPTYAVLAVLTLALGVGGTAAVYSLVKGLLLDPLPYRDEAGVAVFWNPFDWSEREFLMMRGRFSGFSSVAAYRTRDVTLEQGDGPARLLPGISSSSELFGVLGAAPLLGRGFQPGDDRLGGEPIVVLSWSTWQELGGRPSILGTRLRIGGSTRTVVGVMPRGFWFPDPTIRVWMPEPLNEQDGSGNYALVGRAAPGMRVDHMQPQLARITKFLGENFTYPAQWDKTKGAALTPVRQFLLGSLKPVLAATLAAMAVLLLMACANVAALMLGQVDRRSTEFAVRSALGAERRRLTQQLAAEALLVGLLAGAVGAILAAAGFRLLVAALPLGAWAERASLSWTLFGTALLVALAAAVAVAVVPAVALWRGDLRGALSRSRTSGIRGRGTRLESVLVVAEAALAVLMAAGAALLIRSVVKLYAIDPGIDPSGVAVLDVTLPAQMEPPQRIQVLGELARQAAALPGVRSAAVSHKLPLRGQGSSFDISIPGHPELDGTTTFFRIVSRDYVQTLGMRVKRGRAFLPSDRADTTGAIVINQALADRYFAGVDPIGRRIAGGFGGGTVVGVIENAAEAELTAPPAPAQYVLYDGSPFTDTNQSLAVRIKGGGDPAAVLPALRDLLNRVAPGAAVQQSTTLARIFDEAVGPARQIMGLLSIIAALALVLGAIGIYGTISHFVDGRRREFSIRIALGLAPRRVTWQVIRRGAAPVLAGIAVGALAVVVLARVLAAFLYHVGTADPAALASASAALLAVGLVAAAVPAFRAARSDPAVALREQ
jgi:putative ABC transport system permease protein